MFREGGTSELLGPGDVVAFRGADPADETQIVAVARRTEFLVVPANAARRVRLAKARGRVPGRRRVSAL